MFPVVADEDGDRAIIEKLRDSGVSVFSIDEKMKGAHDPEVLRKADELNYPILTFDEEFARAYSSEHPFLYVTSQPSDDAVVASIRDVLEHQERDEISGLIHISPG